MINRNMLMISKVNLSKATSILIIALVFYSCSSISVFSPEAYKQAVDLKVESLNLMSFASHMPTMKKKWFTTELDKMSFPGQT
jgi:hypothetical protein